MTIFVNLKDIIGFAIFALIGVVVVYVLCWQALKQYRCKHKNYFENRACNAICCDCGKDLGFIGSLRGKVK